MSREKPEACDCCGFETSDLTGYADQLTTIAGGGSTRRDDFWYCDLCAATMASQYSRYPNQTPSNTDVLKAISLVGNKILAALKESKT